MFEGDDSIYEDMVKREREDKFGPAAMDRAYSVKAATFRAEELLLEKIYERLSRSNKAHDETENDYDSGYVQGWGECMDTLWDIIQEHNENNQWKLRK